jgi:hypothetical protein
MTFPVVVENHPAFPSPIAIHRNDQFLRSDVDSNEMACAQARPSSWYARSRVSRPCTFTY